MRLVFMGTPDFAVPTLELLAASDHEIVSVVTRPDAQRGRGRKVSAPEVKAAAESLGLPVLQPESLKDEAFQSQLRDLAPDLFVVVAFLILPRSLLKVPRYGSINLHPSLLPKYRGAAPIQWAIIKGEKETGLTTFQLKPKVDAGDVLIQRTVAIGPDETAGELYERLKFDGAQLVSETVDGFANGSLTPLRQNDAGASPAPKLTKVSGRIDWSQRAVDIRNLVRGTNPFPGAFTEWKNGILKVHSVRLTDDVGEAGTVVKADPRERLVIAAGEGALALDLIQPQGKKAMDGGSFLLGNSVDIGERFG
jgi:methionyl-tRNA formyltransferase